MKNLSLEITFPVLNEEKRIEEGVSMTIEFLQRSIIPSYKIVIADNGSVDRTEEIAMVLEKRYTQVSYIKVWRKGVGLALKKSWNNSDTDIIGYMDVDLATDINYIIDAYLAMQRDDIDIVNGSRILPGSKVLNRSILREITSRGFNFVLKAMLNTKFTDGMCGFKFMKKAAYDKLIKFGLDNNGWFFCTEMLIKAEWIGLNIHEIPVQWKDGHDSRVVISTTIYKYMKEIMRVRAEKFKRNIS